MVFDRLLAKKWLEMDKNTTGVGGVASNYFGGKSLRGLSQNVGLDQGKLHGVRIRGVLLATA